MLAKLVRPYHLKLFFSGKHIHATIVSKIDNTCVVSASTNNSQFLRLLGKYAPKNDEKACEEVAKLLAKKAARKKVGCVLGCKRSCPSSEDIIYKRESMLFSCIIHLLRLIMYLLAIGRALESQCVITKTGDISFLGRQTHTEDHKEAFQDQGKASLADLRPGRPRAPAELL